MYNELRKYFANRFQFSNNDFELIVGQFVSKNVRKCEFLQHAGDVAKYAAFVEKGCLRMYVIDHKSMEHIVQFAPETWWLNDSSSLFIKTPSKYYIDAIENSEVLLLEPSGHQKLADNFPGYLAAYQAGVQKHLAAKNERIAASLNRLPRNVI
jgi:CRP/FNR family transcriptional regulator, anaerobic regulatory protein